MPPDNLAFLAGILVGILVAFVFSGLLLLLLRLTRQKGYTRQKVNLFGVLTLLGILGSGIGYIAGFTTGVRLGEFYGPLTGAMGGFIGGAVGGIVGGVFIYKVSDKR